MPVYEYKGLDAAGKSVKGIHNADTKGALRQYLQAKGVYVTDVWEGKAGAGEKRDGDVDFKKMFERVGIRDISILTRQLATLTRAGIPLVESLNALSDQADKEELKRVLSEVRQKVNEGSKIGRASCRERVQSSVGAVREKEKM